MTGTKKKVRSLFLATLMVLSVVAPMVAFSGSAAAAANTIDKSPDNDPTDRQSDHYDTKLFSSQGPYWQGQRFVIDVPSALTGSDNKVQLREVESRDGGGQRVSSLATEVSVDSSTRDAIVDTSNLEGEYVITTGSSNADVINFEAGIAQNNQSHAEFNSSGTVDGRLTGSSTPSIYDAVEEASFEISAQNVNAGFQDADVAQEKTFLDFSSARSGSDLLVTADGLDDDEVVEIFRDEVSSGSGYGGTAEQGAVDGIYDASGSDAYPTSGFTATYQNSNYDDGVVFEGVDSNANISANFTDVDIGDYEFEFETIDSGASDSASVSVTEEEDVNAEFLNGGVATAAQGDYAVIPIQLEETDDAFVNVGFNDVNFNATFHVEDGNDDGLVTVQMNTFVAGQGSNATLEDALTPVENTDTITATGSVDGTGVGMRGLGSPGGKFISGPMEPSQYDVNITKNDNELDVGTLQIVEPQVSGINSWTMPGEVFDDVEENEPGELYEYVENGELTEDNSVAEGDVLVYQIQSTSMFGALRAEEDSTRASDFTEAFNNIAGTTSTSPFSGDFKFAVNQTDETTRPNLDPKQLDLGASSTGIKVVPDDTNSSLFVVMNERDMKLDRSAPSGGASLEMNDGETYTANWTVSEDSGVVDDGQYVTDDASIVEQSIDFDTDAGDIIRVDASAGQTISGSTSVAPGTELNIRLRSTGESPFLEDQEAIVSENGTFSTTFDLSDRAQNATFDANAQGFDEDYDTQGVIGDAASADITFDDQTVEEGAVSVDATLSEGGFVSIRSGSADGEIVGTSSYLDSGTTTADIDVSPLSNETTLYAVAHMDTNDNQALDFEPGGDTDTAYMLNGSAVSDSATVSPASEEPVDNTTEDPSDTTDEPVDTTEEPADTTEAPADTDEQTTTEGGPGFTAVLALVALVAAALLAVRRRD